MKSQKHLFFFPFDRKSFRSLMSECISTNWLIGLSREKRKKRNFYDLKILIFSFY